MELTRLIATEAARIDAVMRRDIETLAAACDPLLIGILEHGLFSGGKRIRPFLATTAARLCGCEDEGIYRLATAFEYLHAATLIHDDVIDNAAERRGAASVVNRFGLAAAILAGDFLHAHSMQLVSSYGGPGALTIFCRATVAMVDGEYRQLRQTGNLGLTEEEYLAMVKGKTAYLIGAACEIGGLYGGGDEALRQGLREFGIGLGCAFQIIDDLLDYQGDAAETGKSTGNDLVEGKLTLPLIYALQRAGDQDRAALRSILADPGARGHSLAEVSAIIEGCGGFDRARRRAGEIMAASLAALPRLDDEDRAAPREILEALAAFVLNRRR